MTRWCLSHHRPDEEEQDNAQIVGFGSSLPPLDSEQHARFRRLVLDLRLGPHLGEKSVQPVYLEEKERGVKRVKVGAGEAEGEPKLIMLHWSRYI